MAKHFLLFIALALVAPESSARSRPVRPSADIPKPNSVLWVAAHPDDEVLVAPLLAKWCLDDGARCGLLVLTRGEAGTCVLPGGCLPDVASTRSSEAGAASELFRADSVILRYPDGGGVLPPLWNTPSRDQPPLVARIADHIRAFDPEVVLTFDPRHGTTCHPDHHEVGRLVLEAVQALEIEPEVYLLETYVRYTASGSPQFMTALPESLRFDATQLFVSGEEAWSAVTWDMERHRSQFTPEFIDAVRNISSDQRAVFIAPAETALRRAGTVCP